jgi:hypothetical protein
VPDTPDLAVVNCEPTVRVFSILLPIYFILLPTFVDNTIVAYATDIVKHLG